MKIKLSEQTTDNAQNPTADPACRITQHVPGILDCEVRTGIACNDHSPEILAGVCPALERDITGRWERTGLDLSARDRIVGVD